MKGMKLQSIAKMGYLCECPWAKNIVRERNKPAVNCQNQLHHDSDEHAAYMLESVSDENKITALWDATTLQNICFLVITRNKYVKKLFLHLQFWKFFAFQRWDSVYVWIAKCFEEHWKWKSCDLSPRSQNIVQVELSSFYFLETLASL